MHKYKCFSLDKRWSYYEVLSNLLYLKYYVRCQMCADEAKPFASSGRVLATTERAVEYIHYKKHIKPQTCQKSHRLWDFLWEIACSSSHPLPAPLPCRSTTRWTATSGSTGGTSGSASPGWGRAPGRWTPSPTSAWTSRPWSRSGSQVREEMTVLSIVQHTHQKPEPPWTYYYYYFFFFANVKHFVFLQTALKLILHDST